MEQPQGYSDPDQASPGSHLDDFGMESDQEPAEPPVKESRSPIHFVLVRRTDGRYDRYLRLEHVPAELAGGVLEYEDLQRMRKGDVEAIRSIICGEPNKEYRTQDAALESLLYQIGRMPVVQPPSTEEPALAGSKPWAWEKTGKTKKDTRRAPTKFVLSYPQGLGNVVKDLPPQAQAVVEALVSAAERRGGDPSFTEEQIHAVLNLDENKERLATRQPPERIFQYYRRRIIDAGILREVK